MLAIDTSHKPEVYRSCSPAFLCIYLSTQTSSNEMCLQNDVPKLSAVADRDRTSGANAATGPAAQAAAPTTATGTSDDFILRLDLEKMEERREDVVLRCDLHEECGQTAER